MNTFIWSRRPIFFGVALRIFLDGPIFATRCNNHCNSGNLHPSELTSSITEAVQLLNPFFEVKEVSLLKKLKEMVETNIDMHNEPYKCPNLNESKSQRCHRYSTFLWVRTPLFNVTFCCVPTVLVITRITRVIFEWSF
jgi:hypothetical protein